MRPLIVGLGLLIAFQVEEAGAATVDSRLKAVENKTSYFFTAVKSQRFRFKRPKSADDVGTDVGYSTHSVRFGPPKATSPYIAYSWFTVTIGYEGMMGGMVAFSVTKLPRGGSSDCGAEKSGVVGAGTVTLKTFCSFDLNPGDKLRVTVLTGDGTGAPTDNLLSGDVKVKNNFVEMLEPQ